MKYISVAAPVASLGGAELSFHGAGQNVTVPRFGNNAPISEITIEFWQYANAAVEQSTFVLMPDDASNRINAHIPYANGMVYWDFGNISGGGRLSYYPSIDITGSWQHFAFVSSLSGANNPQDSGPYMAIYRNGVLDAYKNGASIFTHNAADLLIGGSSGFPFGGQMDEFRIWNIARPAARIAADVNASLQGNEPGLVAYYRFDEGKGTTAKDAAANHYDGTVNSSVTWAASGAAIDTLHALPGVPTPFTLAAFDPNGTTDTFAIASTPTKGTLSGSSPALTYTPGTNYDGSDVFTYTASNGTTTSNTATVKVNYGIPTAVLGGTLQFRGLAAFAGPQNVTVQFRDPNTNAALFTRSVTVPASGSLSIAGVPLQDYMLWIKPELFLAKTVGVTAGSTFSSFTLGLDGGDANNDNSVDIADFGILVNAYNGVSSDPNSGYSANADFTGDGTIDIADFGILVNNYNTQGDF